MSDRTYPKLDMPCEHSVEGSYSGEPIKTIDWCIHPNVKAKYNVFNPDPPTVRQVGLISNCPITKLLGIE